MKLPFHLAVVVLSIVLLLLPPMRIASTADLAEVRQRGVLRHLGVPYANFVTGSGDGLDVEVVKLFARYLGVRYEYVKTSWDTVIDDLIGQKVKPVREKVEFLGAVPVRGDIVANGLTVLPWREKVVLYSTPTFPTQVWIITHADSPMKPINPSGDISKDIDTVKKMLKGCSILGKMNTCLDPSLYGLQEAGAVVKPFNSNLNDLAPAIIKGEAETTLLDVPDSLIALEKWSGKIKVLGPVSHMQRMAYAFAKDSGQLRQAFNQFFDQCKKDGTYLRLVKKYYPGVLRYHPEFFSHE
jgi:ABC-type amino acid transport substrate-binding protein